MNAEPVQNVLGVYKMTADTTKNNYLKGSDDTNIEIGILGGVPLTAIADIVW